MMKTCPVRKTSPRLNGHDYSLPGLYFVTINTHKNIHIFGKIIQGKMQLNPAGNIVQNFWENIPDHCPGLQLDTFIVMPNHLHGILLLTDESPNRKSVSEIIRGFKTWSAKKINEMHGNKGSPVWQCSFHDHIIRNEQSLAKIREYIINNPIKWEINMHYHSYEDLFM
jgi:REP element-mobilizing transposase RayT